MIPLTNDILRVVIFEIKNFNKDSVRFDIYVLHSDKTISMHQQEMTNHFRFTVTTAGSNSLITYLINLATLDKGGKILKSGYAAWNETLTNMFVGGSRTLIYPELVKNAFYDGGEILKKLKHFETILINISEKFGNNAEYRELLHRSRTVLNDTIMTFTSTFEITHETLENINSLYKSIKSIYPEYFQ